MRVRPTDQATYLFSPYSASALSNVSPSSPRSFRHFWKIFLSSGNCTFDARCCPATSDLTTPEISLCLCTLISGSSCTGAGSGARVENTSGCAGASNVFVAESIPTGS